MRERTIVASRPDRCLRPGCPRDAVRGKRGLCSSDYNVQADMVRKRIYTWEQLEQAGICLTKERTSKQWVTKIMGRSA